MGSLFIYFGLFLLEYLLGKQIGIIRLSEYDRHCNDARESSLRYVPVSSLKVVFLSLLMICVFTLIVGYRYGIGADYLQYENIINSYKSIDGIDLDILNRISYEVGFYLLCKLVFFLGGDTVSIFALAAFITFYFINKTIAYYSENGREYGMMAFISTLLLLGPSMNIVKQVIACSIIYYSFRYIFEKKLLLYTVFVLLASSFHVSAIIFIIFYAVNITQNDIGKFKETIITLGIILVPIFFQGLFNKVVSFSLFSGYTEYGNKFSIAINLKNIAFLLPIIVPLFVFRKRIIEKDSRNRFFYIVLVSELVSIILSYSMHWAIRLSYYFIFAEAMLVAQLIEVSSRYKNIWQLYYVICYLIFFCLKYFYWGNDGIFPYVSIFQ